MPPRKKASPRKAPSPPAKRAKAASCDKKQKAVPTNGKKKRAGPYKMPPPIPKGEILTDLRKNKWCLGTSVGKGGFGEIYTACPNGKSIDGAQFVIKIEPHENGPLFTELSFYTRIAKPERIVSWIKSHDQSYLAVPKFIASGSHNHGGTRFRFMVMERFGEDVEKKFTSAGRKFSLGTVCYLAIQLIEALEFLHESEYVHADVKGSNLLTGFGRGHCHEVYLVDYGLAYRYCPDGEHKPYKEDPRKAHDGTIEFTSIDAHKGVNPSRRADMEILGYCLLQWASGRLPWEGKLENKDVVARMKIKYHGDSEGLLKACFGSDHYPACLRQYIERVYQLAYQDKPNYTQLKHLFTKQLRDLGCHGDGREMLDWMSSRKSGQKRKAHVAEVVDESSESEQSPPPTKKKRITKTVAMAASKGSPDTATIPSPLHSEEQSTAYVPERKSRICQKKPVSTKGQKRSTSAKCQKKDVESSSGSTPAMVYYPKSLGYANSDESSEGGEWHPSSGQSSEDESLQPPTQKKRKRQPKKMAHSSVEEEAEGPSKKRRVPRKTITKTKNTTAKKRT